MRSGLLHHVAGQCTNLPGSFAQEESVKKAEDDAAAGKMVVRLSRKQAAQKRLKSGASA